MSFKIIVYQFFWVTMASLVGLFSIGKEAFFSCFFAGVALLIPNLLLFFYGFLAKKDQQFILIMLLLKPLLCALLLLLVVIQLMVLNWMWFLGGIMIVLATPIFCQINLSD